MTVESLSLTVEKDNITYLVTTEDLKKIDDILLASNKDISQEAPVYIYPSKDKYGFSHSTAAELIDMTQWIRIISESLNVAIKDGFVLAVDMNMVVKDLNRVSIMLMDSLPTIFNWINYPSADDLVFKLFNVIQTRNFHKEYENWITDRLTKCAKKPDESFLKIEPFGFVDPLGNSKSVNDKFHDLIHILDGKNNEICVIDENLSVQTPNDGVLPAIKYRVNNNLYITHVTSSPYAIYGSMWLKGNNSINLIAGDVIYLTGVDILRSIAQQVNLPRTFLIPKEKRNQTFDIDTPVPVEYDDDENTYDESDSDEGMAPEVDWSLIN